ncbi:MAG: LapA family protein [Actinomycetota bacterium]|nr:LapA family protein [Actinomycetota bacterium]
MAGPADTDPEVRSGELEARGDRARRYARRTKLYAYAAALVALLVVLIALIVANTRTVKVSWVFGSTRQSLVWIILVTGLVGWLLGIVTSIVFRYRTRRPRSAPPATSP